jgi:hypothetical protein
MSTSAAAIELMSTTAPDMHAEHCPSWTRSTCSTAHVGRNVLVIAASLSALAATGLDLWIQQRAVPGHRMVGEQTEQDCVMDSYQEAAERDLMPSQWMTSYAKRAQVDG